MAKILRGSKIEVRGRSKKELENIGRGGLLGQELVARIFVAGRGFYNTLATCRITSLAPWPPLPCSITWTMPTSIYGQAEQGQATGCALPSGNRGRCKPRQVSANARSYTAPPSTPPASNGISSWPASCVPPLSVRETAIHVLLMRGRWHGYLGGRQASHDSNRTLFQGSRGDVCSRL